MRLYNNLLLYLNILVSNRNEGGYCRFYNDVNLIFIFLQTTFGSVDLLKSVYAIPFSYSKLDRKERLFFDFFFTFF